MQLSNNVVLACAGSGKTWGICNDAIFQRVGTKKVLMVSYTHKGVYSLNNEYTKQNYGVVDNHVKICTWFQFLLQELIKPYQSEFLKEINKIESCDFSQMYGEKFDKKNTRKYFLNNENDVKANNASEFALYLNQLSGGAVLDRLEEVYSCIYIDELQDLVGRDIELLELLFLSSIKIYCVGDYKQSTLKTHNAKSNKDKCGVHVFDYVETLKNSHNLEIIKSNCSRRFIQDIANFVNMICPSDPVISIVEADEKAMGVYQILKKDVPDYISNFKPDILRYDKRSSTMDYPALNFGVCKGMTMKRVLIFPNKPLKAFLLNPSKKMDSPEKYYVGSTRAMYSLAFVLDKLKPNDYFENDIIELANGEISVLKYVKT